jgi:hypothetical protein
VTALESRPEKVQLITLKNRRQVCDFLERIESSRKRSSYMTFKTVHINTLDMNPFTKISKEWLLITAGTVDNCNTMTASWGGLGFLWNRNVATVYIRPQLHETICG